MVHAKSAALGPMRFGTLPAIFKASPFPTLFNGDNTTPNPSNDEAADRDCFRTFFKALVTPKVLIYLTAPIFHAPQKTLFEQYSAPIFEKNLSIVDHTATLFKQLFNVHRLFTPGDPYML